MSKINIKKIKAVKIWLMREFISDIIGDEYKEWETQNIVFLTAPTGSGKTSFVLDKLVKYVESKKNSKILYLVNRKILKNQIESTIRRDISCKVENINEIIKVKTYQELEKSSFYEYEKIGRLENEEFECDDLEYNGFGDKKWQYGESGNYGYDSQNITLRRYDIIIADECHYFFSDSTYNPHTCKSYDWIMSKHESALLVFMSATIDQIKRYILKDFGYKRPEQEFLEDSEEEQIQRMSERIIKEVHFVNHIPYGKFCVKEYLAKADYSHVDIHILENDESIIEIITGKKEGEEYGEKINKEKWIVFVDSIKRGNNLHRKLKNKGIDSVFIESRWVDEYDELIFGTVAKIAKEQSFDQQVVVATSVIDNGVSISDIELRNLVIMADTEEQFIQMLGRKRVDYDINKEPKRINLYILKSGKNVFERRLSGVEDNIEYINKYYNKDDCPFELLSKILKHPDWVKCCRQICYIEKGICDAPLMILNKFSKEQYVYLKENYEKIIKRFDAEDEYAFIRQQAEWMGINNIEEVINDYSTSLKDKVSSIIEGYMGKELDRNTNIELRENIRLYLRTLLKECEANTPENKEIKNLITNMGKRSNKNTKYPERFTEYRFNKIMSILDMRYEMEGTVKDQVIIKVVNTNT